MAVTGSIGDAEVRLENAAEEATMQKILDTLKDMDGMGSAGGAALGGGIGGALGGMAKLGKSVNVANVAFGALGKGLGVVTGMVGSLAKLGSASVGLGAEFIATQPKVTDLASGIKKVTGDFLGLGSALEAVVKLLYANYTTFQSLSASGIAFGDRLEYMNSMAASLGIGLDQLSGTLVTNVANFARLGTGTRGAQMAIDDAATAFDMHSASLLRFGLSFEEQNETFMRFFAQNSLALANETLTRQQLIDMSDDYAKGIRRLMELTGAQADEIQASIDRANMNKAFESFMSGLDGAEKQRMESIIAQFGRFGQEGEEAAMAMIMGVAPLTEGAAQLMTINQGFSNTLRNSVHSARNFSGTLEQFDTGLRNSITTFANGQTDYVRNNSRFFASLALSGDPLGNVGGNLIAGINQFRGGLDDTASNLGRTSPLAQAFANLEKLLQTLREKFTDAFVAVLTNDNFQQGMDKFATFISDVTNSIEQEGFFNYIKRIFSETLLYLKMAINDTFLGGMFVENDPIRQQLRKQYEGKSLAELQELSQNAQFGIERQVASRMMNERNNENRDLVSQALEDEINARKGPLEEYLSGNNGRWFAPVYDPGDGSGYQIRGDYEPREGELSRENLQRLVDSLNQMTTLLPSMGAGYDDYFDPLADPMTTLRLMDQLGITPAFRTYGTYGATGRTTEPEDTLAYIHKDERVLNKSEAQAYNNTPNSNQTNLAKMLVDTTREGSVKLETALNTLIRKMEQQNSLTRQVISTVEQYSA